MTVNYAGAATAITAQLTDALDAAMPILGMVVGCVIGIAFFIRISKGYV